ncbi:MAG: protein-L-isoaspartate O-methyltransferase [Alphaproteobacteria bacterium]
MIATSQNQWPDTKSALFRQNMVNGQLRTNHVRDGAVLAAMEAVRREDFVPGVLHSLAYSDEDLAIGRDRYMLAPAVLGRMVQAVSLVSGDKVLDIGCLTGYSPTVLSQLCQRVIGLESDLEFAIEARRHHEDSSKNVRIVQGELAQGYAEQAPYDVILLEGAIDSVPHELLDQLGDGGRLVAVIGGEAEVTGTMGLATLFVKTGDVVTSRVLFDCAVPRLPGFAQKPAFIF